MTQNDATALVPLITTDAKLVSGQTISIFNDNVERAVRDGWRPSGSIFVLNQDPAIMMVKYDYRIAGLLDKMLDVLKQQLTLLAE